jgi:hypothetical protein
MKLRNKKTGEIGEFMGTYNAVPFIGIGIDYHDGNPVKYEYNTLTELNEEWEDYKPTEPLIKDEKIRKAVRAWAEANNVTKVWHEGSSVGFCDGAVSIKFHELCWEEIPKGEYTITELCGEEEE